MAFISFMKTVVLFNCSMMMHSNSDKKVSLLLFHEVWLFSCCHEYNVVLLTVTFSSFKCAFKAGALIYSKSICCCCHFKGKFYQCFVKIFYRKCWQSWNYIFSKIFCKLICIDYCPKVIDLHLLLFEGLLDHQWSQS